MLRFRDRDIARLREALAPAVSPPPAAANWLESAVHRRILVHTTADQSIEGLLTFAGDDGILLWGAVLRSAKPEKLDGEVFVPRNQVLFVQTVRM